MAVKVTKKLINDALKPLRGKTPDQIAELVKETVGKAYCRNANACAIAQFVANQLPEGLSVSVDGISVAVSGLTEHGNVDWENEQFVDLPQRVSDFIGAFDEFKYPELLVTDNEGYILMDDHSRAYRWDTSGRVDINIADLNPSPPSV